jgi:MFS family permease
MRQSLRQNYLSFPSPFRILMGATFIDQMGRFLLLPFFALYITQRFQVGLTEVGYLFALFSGFGLIGSLFGGAITDRFGRKALLIFGLVVSGLSSLTMGLVDDIAHFYALAAFVGLLSDAAGPAAGAMIADLLPEHQRADGYSLQRVVLNLAATLGPALGGLLAARSYFLLFAADALLSAITAIIVFILIPETKPADVGEKLESNVFKTLGGYGTILRDKAFMAFFLISILATVIYVQFGSTLSVYLRDIHNIPPAGYGSLLSLNGILIVLFQLWVTRRSAAYPPMQMMALGALLYGIGFGLYGFGSSFLFFAFAMAVVTLGEMVITPVGQALVARFAPQHMRGRYMASFGFTWGIAFIIGPLAGGLVMDNYDPRWVWYGCLILGAISALGYLALRAPAAQRLSREPA